MSAAALGWAVALGAATMVYARRWHHARRDDRRAASGWRLVWWLGAVAALAAALVFPFDDLAQESLTLHVAQHILVFDAAPILLVSSLTPAILAPLAPMGRWVSASPVAHVLLRNPYVVVAIYVATLWLLHLPPLYEAALEHPALHVVQHAGLLGAGLLFWWQELAPPEHRRTGELAGVLYLVGAKLLTGTFATALILAPDALYEPYVQLLGADDAREDQRMAGGGLVLIEGTIFILAVTAVFIRMLGESGHDDVDDPD